MKHTTLLSNFSRFGSKKEGAHVAPHLARALPVQLPVDTDGNEVIYKRSEFGELPPLRWRATASYSYLLRE